MHTVGAREFCYRKRRDCWLRGWWRSTCRLAPAVQETSGIVNPPVHAAAVRALLQRDASPASLRFAAGLLPKLQRFLDYLSRERDPDGNGLAFVRHPWENGMDNSPAWAEVLEDGRPLADSV